MRQMWFGTRGYEQWIKEPNADMDQPYTGRYDRANHRNGGVSLSASATGHREYSMQWTGKIDDLEAIADTLTGVWDTDANDGLIYFVDPSAATRNVLPKLWAAPYLCGLDAPSLTKTARPTLAATATNTFRLPSRTATFTVGSSNLASLYIPIPPGYSLQFGFYGPSAQSNKIRATPTGGSASDYGIIANASYGTGMTTISGVSGVTLSLTPSGGMVSLTAGLAQILYTGSTLPAPTQFISGKGNSGCRIDGAPGRVINSANAEINWGTYSAHLVEVGDWL